MRKLDKFLDEKFTRRDDLARQLRIVRVFDIYKSVLKAGGFAGKVHPVSITKGILTVVAGSGAEASELRFYEKAALGEINAKLGKATVARIRYRF